MLIGLGLIFVFTTYLITDVDDGFVSKAYEEVKQGNSLEYIGRTEWPKEKSKAFVLKDDSGTKRYVYFKFTKPTDEGK
jgi:hypothetical protein|tara:strand:- start:297 stop:530 length:234 start_codon:yes stop_codon:yes gene_type:complete